MFVQGIVVPFGGVDIEMLSRACALVKEGLPVVLVVLGR